MNRRPQNCPVKICGGVFPCSSRATLGEVLVDGREGQSGNLIWLSRRPPLAFCLMVI
jgi:hypothetical protein